MKKPLGRVVAVAVAVLSVGLEVPALGQEKVHVQVGSVLATNSNTYFDAHLAAMRPQLERLFRYTSYQLVAKESRDVEWGAPAGFEIPGARFLRVTPKSRADGKIALHLSLTQQAKTLVSTDFQLRDQGTMMIGGPRHEGGNLIIWIGASSEGPPEEQGQAVSPSPRLPH